MTPTGPTRSPFCEPRAEAVVSQSPVVLVLRDGFPLNPGHTLVVPRRHVGSFFETTAAEQAELLEALLRARSRLDAEHAPAGYNVGINDGPAAGQSVAHCHLHLIPRYASDVADPRGGVRWLIPDRARYW